MNLCGLLFKCGIMSNIKNNIYDLLLIGIVLLLVKSRNLYFFL